MSMVKSQILKFMNFTETQKFRYLENETFFLQIKKFVNYTSALYGKKYFCNGVNLLEHFFFIQHL